MHEPNFLSVVIPAFNEAGQFRRSLPPVLEYLRKQSYRWEIILVNDGSADQTSRVFQEMVEASHRQVIENSCNRGKGYSVRKGFQAARGDWVLMSDADFSTPIREIEKFLPHMENGVDLLIGSRSLPESDIIERQSWCRENMGRFFNILVQSLVLKGFIDTQCGFKCFRKASLEPVFSLLTVDRFSFDVELLFLARKSGMKILEIPVEWKNVEFSRVHMLKDSLSMLCDLFRIRWKHQRRRYKKPSAK